MTGKMKSFVIGLIGALPVKPLPLASKEPIAYLYNGVQLPDINEVWTDKESYPYAYIGTSATEPNLYQLVTVNVALDAGGNDLLFVNQVVSIWTFVIYDLVDGEWMSKSYTGATIKGVWCSADVLYSNTAGELAGTLYLAASDPIPVYE